MNHNLQSDGQNNSAKSGMNLQKKTTHTNSTPGSSALRNPPPKSPCVGKERRVGLGQTLPAGSPIVGSIVSPCTERYWSTYYVHLGRRIIVFAYVDVIVRGRDECPSSEERTQPRYIVPVLPPLPHRDGVAGLLKHHRACRDCRGSWRVRVGPPVYVNVQVHAAWKALDWKLGHQESLRT